MAVRASKTVTTSIDTGDGVIKSSAGRVFWIIASAGATGGAWQLNDSTDDGGTDLIGAVSPASSIVSIPLDPPLEFANGIYADIPGTNVTLTVGYQ